MHDCGNMADKYREFWIPNHQVFPLSETDNHIHVIEYAAYEELKSNESIWKARIERRGNKIKKLVEQNQLMREALEWFKNRDLSDLDEKYVEYAEQTLEKLDELEKRG